MSKNTSLVAIVFLLAATAGLFLWGAEAQFRRNSNMTRTDQINYMDYAKRSRSVSFGYVPNRNYMPVYPYVQSFFHRDEMPDEQYFRVGKRVNIAIAIMTAAFLYVLFLRKNCAWDATVAVCALALSLIAFKAPCFQPELLFLFINLTMFIAQLSLVLRPSWRMALMAGALSGLAYLTKGSVPPAIALTVFCLVGRGVARLIGRRGAEAPQHRVRRMAEPFLAAVVFAVALAATLYPFLRASHKMYGRWVCENNSHFFWCDSWKECMDLMASVGGEQGLYRADAAILPGPLTYWRTHGMRDITTRLADGFQSLFRQHFRWGYGYMRFVMVYGVCLGIMAFQRRHAIRAWLHKDGNIWGAVYGVCYFAGYLVLCMWYTYIDKSSRFALILLYPAFYLTIRGLQAARKGEITWNLFGSEMKPSAVSAIVFVVLVEYVLFDFSPRISVLDGTY